MPTANSAQIKNNKNTIIATIIYFFLKAFILAIIFKVHHRTINNVHKSKTNHPKPESIAWH